MVLCYVHFNQRRYSRYNNLAPARYDDEFYYNRRLARVVFGGLAILLIRLLQKFISSLGKLT